MFHTGLKSIKRPQYRPQITLLTRPAGPREGVIIAAWRQSLGIDNFGKLQLHSVMNLIEALILTAQALHRQGRRLEAIAAYRQILDLVPEHWDAESAVAALTLEGSDLKAAIRMYDALAARRSDHAEIYYKRANAFNGLGRWSDALNDSDRAIALRPDLATRFAIAASSLNA